MLVKDIFRNRDLDNLNKMLDEIGDYFVSSDVSGSAVPPNSPQVESLTAILITTVSTSWSYGKTVVISSVPVFWNSIAEPIRIKIIKNVFVSIEIIEDEITASLLGPYVQNMYSDDSAYISNVDRVVESSPPEIRIYFGR